MKSINRKYRLGALAVSAITLLAMGGEPAPARADGKKNDCPCKSQGYYKNHDFCYLLGSGNLPGRFGYTGRIGSVPYFNFARFNGQRGLLLGDFAYTCEQLQDILSEPVQGNGALILAKQLIAAKLNVLSGCPASREVLAAIAAADILLWQSTIGHENNWIPRMLPPVGTATLPSNYYDYVHGLSLQEIKDILENYNLCGDD